MASSKTNCAGCGKQCSRSQPQRGWTPPTQQWCQPCRRLKRPVCACGAPMYRESKMCAKCRRAQYGEIGDQTGRRAGRKAWHVRSNSAPGLSYRARRRLLIKWKRQRRICVYCPSVCEVIDHVIPLISGGTNFEGNLAPSCCACNLSKGPDLVIVWRHRLLATKSTVLQRVS